MKKKAGSFRGGRKPLEKRDRILDRDRDRKALQRATKAGFATVAEHRASIAAKEAARQANLFTIADGQIRPRTYKAPARPVVEVQAAPVADEWPTEEPSDFHTEAALSYVPPPPPAPVKVEGRQPKKYNLETKQWEAITSQKEQEALAGLRVVDRDAFRGNCRPADPNAENPKMGIWDFEQATRDAKRRDHMAADNERRYW